MVKKLFVGFYSFCGSGVHTKMVHEWLLQNPLKYNSLLDIQSAVAFQTNESNTPIDIAFIEGCIATEHQKKEVKAIRDRSKKVILLGTDTIDGHPHHQRNHFPFETFSLLDQSFMEKNQLKNIQTPQEVILVDGKIHGNPIDKMELEKMMLHWCREWGILEKKNGKHA